MTTDQTHEVVEVAVMVVIELTVAFCDAQNSLYCTNEAVASSSGSSMGYPLYARQSRQAIKLSYAVWVHDSAQDSESGIAWHSLKSQYV